MPVTRRKFQHVAFLAFPLVYAAGLMLGALRFLTPLPRRPREKERDLEQKVDYFTKAGVAPVEIEFNGSKIFILHDGSKIRAFDAMCTHLSCNVDWEETEGVFKCPCHGACFERNGRVQKLPATTPLRELAIAPISAEGTVTVLDRIVAPDATVS